MTRILFVLTSHTVLGDTGVPTGYHLGEVVQPWRILTSAGHEVEFVSVLGGRPEMVAVDPGDPEHQAFLADAQVSARLQQTFAPDEVDAGSYAAVYFVGGHGTMWDFRGNLGLQTITRTVYETGGVVAAICHGQAGLLDVRLSDGVHLVSNKRVTAFSNESEHARGLTTVVPFALQTALEEQGARYSCAPDRVAHVVTDGRLLTGQNPASAPELGHRLAAALSTAPQRPRNRALRT
ncbi:MAG: type 1 glutamine amidotransferase domain-containing protein [Kibdelosporangium sp.]